MTRLARPLVVLLFALLLCGGITATVVYARPFARAPQVTRCDRMHPLACQRAIAWWRREADKASTAAAWQKSARLALARELVGNVADWTCIHNGHQGARIVGSGEAAWNDAGDPYWGGLQMDKTFMRTYGGDMIRRHHGGLADTWTPREQIIVAQRAYAQGRGYAPWPNTGRACGLT